MLWSLLEPAGVCWSLVRSLLEGGQVTPAFTHQHHLRRVELTTCIYCKAMTTTCILRPPLPPFHLTSSSHLPVLFRRLGRTTFNDNLAHTRMPRTKNSTLLTASYICISYRTTSPHPVLCRLHCKMRTFKLKETLKLNSSPPSTAVCVIP